MCVRQISIPSPHFLPSFRPSKYLSFPESPKIIISPCIVLVYTRVAQKLLTFLGGRSHKNVSHFWGHTSRGFPFRNLVLPLGRDVSIPKSLFFDLRSHQPFVVVDFCAFDTYTSLNLLFLSFFTSNYKNLASCEIRLTSQILKVSLNYFPSSNHL